jgi:hypothetical protein
MLFIGPEQVLALGLKPEQVQELDWVLVLVREPVAEGISVFYFPVGARACSSSEEEEAWE